MATSETWVNGRWPLQLLDHRAARPEWPWWESHRLAFTHWLISEFIESDYPVVYDVGAEEGDFSALYGTWGAEVVLIEPSPKAWPQIRIHWEMNVDRPPAGFYVGLLSDRDDNGGAGATVTWPHESSGPIIPDHGFIHLNEATNTPTARLEDVRHFWPAPDLIVMDVEGSEKRVLEGAEDTLRRWRPQVLVSVHPEFMADRYGDTPDGLAGWMHDLGYWPRHICTDHETHVWFCPEEKAPEWF